MTFEIEIVQWENLSTYKSLFIFYRPSCRENFCTRKTAVSTDFLWLFSYQRHRLRNLPGTFIAQWENQLLCWKTFPGNSEVTFFFVFTSSNWKKSQKINTKHIFYKKVPINDNKCQSAVIFIDARTYMTWTTVGTHFGLARSVHLV